MRRRLAIVALAGALGAGVVSGCGDSDDGGGGGPAVTTGTAEWPYFGRVEGRTHFIREAPSPPFEVAWRKVQGQLLEFPPALGGGGLYILGKVGRLSAYDTDAGT